MSRTRRQDCQAHAHRRPTPSLRTRLRRNRLWVAAGGVVVAAAAVVGFWALDTAARATRWRVPRRVRATTDGAFRPSETQWASLKLATVRQVAFRDERATDGKIAINEDTTTPVFSPYSGRVSRLIAQPGRLRRTRRAAVRHRSQRVRAGPERPRHRRGRRREGEARGSCWRRPPRSASASCWRSAAARSRTSSRRSPISWRRRATCARPRSRSRPCATGCASSAARTRRSRKLEKVDRIGAETIVVRADRRHDHPAQGRARPVHQRRRHRPGLHGRQSLDGVADRQRARIGRAAR